MNRLVDWLIARLWTAPIVAVVLALAVWGAVALFSPAPSHAPPVLTRVLDTLPTGTIVVCETHDQALACVLDPAMEGATP